MKRTKFLITVLLSVMCMFALMGCAGKNEGTYLSGRYYCPEKDSDSYILDFSPDGTVDTYYNGKGTYSIDKDGTFKLDLELVHGTGTYNDDGSIDFNTTERLSYHYVPESSRSAEETTTGEEFDATIMIEKLPYEYSKDNTSVSEKQTGEDGTVYYQTSCDGSTITGTIGVDKTFLSKYGAPASAKEAIEDVVKEGLRGNNKYFENDNYFLVLMLDGYTDINSAVYNMYLIPKGTLSDTDVYFSSLYFYDDDLHTSIEEFTGFVNGINAIAGNEIFGYTYQDAMASLSKLRSQM